MRRALFLTLMSGGQSDPYAIPVTDGLYARYVADASGYADGAAVTDVLDLSGNSRTLSKSAGTVTYVANQVNGKGVIRAGASGVLNAASFFTTDIVNAGTVVGVWKIITANTEPMWDGTANWWHTAGTISPQGWTYNNTGTVVNFGADGHHQFHVFWDSAGENTYGSLTTHQEVSIGFRNSDSGVGVANSAAGRALQIPRSGQIEFAELLFYGRRLTWTELFSISDYFKYRYGMAAAQDLNGVVISLGNSTTANVDRYLSTQLNTDIGSISYINMARDSGMIAGMNAHQTQVVEVANYFRGKNKKVVVFAHPGHNDDYGGTTNASTNSVIRHLNGADGSTLFAQIRATGAKLLIVGPTCWNSSSSKTNPKPSGATVETYRQALLSWCESSLVSGGYADAYTNVLSSSAEFGVFTADAVPPVGTSLGDYPLLWADNVHQTNPAGETRKAELLSTPIQSVWATA